MAIDPSQLPAEGAPPQAPQYAPVGPSAPGQVAPGRYDQQVLRNMGPAGSNPFTAQLNEKLGTKIETGKSIFDPSVLSTYFNDPSASERDKNTIVSFIQPNLMTAAYDKTVRDAAGEPVYTKSLLGRAVSHFTDVAGKPLGAVFDALQYPADKTEQFFGTVLSLGYNSDLSLGERWKMGRVTYEAYSASGWWKFNGDDKLNEWSQQVSSGQKTVDDILKEHEHGVGDMVGKMIMDPLWLLGGFPAVPSRLYKAGKAGEEVYKAGAFATLFRGLGEGIRLEHFGAEGTAAILGLEKLPYIGKPLVIAGRIMFGGFVPTKEKILSDAMAEWRTVLETAERGPTVQSWRDAKGLFELTPQAKADAIYNHLSISTLLAKSSQDDIRQLAEAIKSGDLDKVPEVFGLAFRSKQGQILFDALKERGVDLAKFPSMLKGIHPDQAVWDAADAAAKSGDKDALELLSKTHRNGDAFIAAFQHDVHEIAYSAIQQWHGVRGDIVKSVNKAGQEISRFVPYHSPVSRFTNGMKFWLSTTLLNNPRFVALNYFNNGMTLAADWGFSRGVKHWLDPFGRRGWKENGLRDLLVAAGLVDEHAKDPIEAIKYIVSDRSVQSEMLGLSGQDDKLLGVSKKLWAPLVTVTSQFDMGARVHAFYEMFGRAHNAVWKFEGTAKGILPDIPEELAMKLGPDVAGRLRGAIIAAGPDAKALKSLAETMRTTGRPPLTAEHYIARMAGQMGLEGDHLQAFHDMFEPAFRTRITALLADAGNSTARLKTRLDMLRGAMRQQEHVAREMDNLTPRARDYSNLPTAMADHEAMMVERDKTQLIQLRRYLTSTGESNVDEALGALAKVQNDARTRRYSLQYASQMLDVLPQNLEKDIMFQMVPESLREGVKQVHSDLVRGLDNIEPGNREFYDVLADLSTKWEDHTNQTVADLLTLPGDAASQPLKDFFESMANVEMDAFKKRDHVFADMINNHPGADAPETAADWVHNTWSQHYKDLDNLYNDALERESGIFGFEHRGPPHARGGDNPTTGEMLGVRNSTLHQYIDYVEKQHLLDREAAPFIDATFGAAAKAALSPEEIAKFKVQRGITPRNSPKYGDLTDFAAHAEAEAQLSRVGQGDLAGARADLAAAKARPIPNKFAQDKIDRAEEAIKLAESEVSQEAAAVERRAAGNFDNVGEYLNEIAGHAPDAKAMISLIARRAADFSMLNYDRRYGIDSWMAMVYPYSFWPTRSMWHWAQRGLSRPGAVAATAKLYSLTHEINTDAGLPERFRNSIRLPIPFLDKAFQGGNMYFDPIKVLFPTADWSADNSSFGQQSGDGGTLLGIPRNAFSTINQWAKVVGPGVNPFIDTALQLAGGDEHALYLKYRFSSMPFMIPGPRMLQAAYSFTQSGEDPENLLDDSTKEKLATGQNLGENQLKQILAMSPDDFDLYRAQRVLANQVDEYMMGGHSIEDRQKMVDQTLKALFTRKGKLWREAQITAQHETGLSVATSYLFGMPVRQYPRGESISRGIAALYKRVQEASRTEGGGDMTAGFNNMFPEASVKNAAVEIFKGTDKQDSEIAGTLFAQELDKVHVKYDQRIVDLNATLNHLSDGKSLTTKEGRRAFDVTETERNALSAQRSAEIDNLDKTYDSRNQEVSLTRTPRTRALQELETAYYAIELPDNPTPLDLEKQKAAQKAFVEKLPTFQSYSPIVSAITHYVNLKKYDHEISAAYDAGDREKATKLIEARQNRVRDTTVEMKTQITQKEFTQYRERNKRVPTTPELERDQAGQQISEYFAIKDRAPSLGYSSKEAASLMKTFWEGHPLLAKYYGHDENITVHTFDDIKKYDRMESIWDQFYSLEGGSQARIDYLAMTATELNGLRSHFGLSPVKITDPYWNHSAPPPRYEGSNPSGY